MITPNGSGILGTTTGYASKDDASRAAVNACTAKGGTACRLDLAYYNPCAAMIVGTGGYRVHGAATVEEAIARGMKARDDLRAGASYGIFWSPLERILVTPTGIEPVFSP